MPERDYVEPIPRGVYTVGRHATPALDVDDDVTHVTVSLLRAAWPNIGAEVIRVAIECSVDGGPWRKSGAVAAAGGNHYHRYGFLMPATTARLRLPRGVGRQVRAQIDVHAALEIKLDVGLRIAPLPQESGSHNSAAFLAENGATGTALTSLTSGSFDGSGSDRAIVAIIGNATFAGGAVVSSCTWDVPSPQSLSSLVTVTGGPYHRCSAWGLANTTSATDTVTANWASTQDEALIIGHAFTGVDTASAFGNTQSGAGTAAEPSVTLTGVVSDDLCLDGVLIETSASASQGADQTLRGDENLGGAYPHHLVSSTQSGSAGGEMTWTVTGSPQWTHVAVVIKGITWVAQQNAPETLRVHAGALRW
jgi:hypothetical protein